MTDAEREVLIELKHRFSLYDLQFKHFEESLGGFKQQEIYRNGLYESEKQHRDRIHKRIDEINIAINQLNGRISDTIHMIKLLEDPIKQNRAMLDNHEKHLLNSGTGVVFKMKEIFHWKDSNAARFKELAIWVGIGLSIISVIMQIKQ